MMKNVLNYEMIVSNEVHPQAKEDPLSSLRAYPQVKESETYIADLKAHLLENVEVHALIAQMETQVMKEVPIEKPFLREQTTALLAAEGFILTDVISSEPKKLKKSLLSFV